MSSSYYNITLVCTRHEELGACSPLELYKIIEQIEPEVIFEEISPESHEKFYIDKKRKNLETNTIYEYSKYHKIKHIPVDTIPLPDDVFFQEYKSMIEKIERLNDINGSTFRNVIDSIKFNSSIYGFKFLNSNVCSNEYKKIDIAVENGIQTLNKEKYFNIFQNWKDIHEKRENLMLKNILDYSKNHEFSKAVFMIGAAHRNSIINKINELGKSTDYNLNWIFFE